MSVKSRLSLMMFLQYAIWGSWSAVLSAYLLNIGFDGMQTGMIYSLLPLATIISPFIGGQIADRYFSTHKIISFLQLSGGVVLIILSRITDYNTMFWLMLLYCLLYAPTLALTNSISLANLENSEKDFGGVRVWGSIGWIGAGLALSGWRLLAQRIGDISYAGDTLLLAGIFSIIMGIQALSLPATPQKKTSGNPWAFIEALKMLKNKNTAIFFLISFVVSTELMFYYVLTAPFLTSSNIGIAETNVPAVMVIAQFAEIFVMALLLPRFLPKYGFRKTMAIGVIAWPLRYIIFAVGAPPWLVVASLALHGFCYVFFFTAAFIYVDVIAPKDIRASAQSLITLIILGLGNYFGSLFAGWIKTQFTIGEITNWRGIFIVPCILTFLCATAFMLIFKEDKTAKN
ncbi:MFS transporter [Candidatus Latescibacterota bacterium]